MEMDLVADELCDGRKVDNSQEMSMVDILADAEDLINDAFMFKSGDVNEVLAAIYDSASNVRDSTWTDEAVQQVPIWNMKETLIQDAKHRFSRTLMQLVGVITSAPLQLDQRTVDAMKAVLNLIRPDVNNRSVEVQWNDFKKSFYAEICMSFIGCRQMDPLKKKAKHAVEALVNKHVMHAKEHNSTILFDDYQRIFETVKDVFGTVPDKGKIIGYVEVYTKAVHAEICARCMSFLKIAGYDLLENSFKDKENDPQQFVETSSNTGSSQTSNPHGPDLIEIMEERMNNGGFPLNVINQQHQNQNDFEGGEPGSNLSQFSMTYDSQTPPQLSLPDSQLPRHMSNDEGPTQMEEVGLNEILIPFGTPSPSLESYGSAGPPLRRARLE